jgi:hypothetical protein
LRLVLLAVAGMTVAILLLLLLALGGPGGGGGSTAPDRAATPASAAAAEPVPRLFSPTSFWNQPLAADAPLSDQSAALVSELVAEAGAEHERGNGPWISTHECSTPIYVVPRGQRQVAVHLTHPHADWRAGLARAFARVPLPPSASPAECVDRHLTVWQPAVDRLWEFFHLRRPDGEWVADWGGAMKGVSRSQGFYSRASWPGLAAPNWGATASSLPVAGGVIRIGELQRGRIGHALAMNVPVARAGVFSWPAQRSDGIGSEATLPEGARLRLDPSLDLETLDLPPLTRTIAAAAQRFGIVVRDQTGSGNAIAFFGEDPRPRRPDPYREPGGLFESSTPADLLADFPWDRLEVLQMTLCSESPCRR